jgi:hypothetical protein
VFSSAASSTPAIICNTNPDSCQLRAYGYGGSGNFTYSWTSIPAGFISTLQNPRVKPEQTTQYAVATSDGTLTRHDTTEMRIVNAPTAFAGNDTTVCWYVSPIALNATATSYLRFLWGSTGDGTFTDPSSLITAYIPGIRDKTSGGCDLKLIVWPLAPCLDKATSMIHIALDPCTGIAEQTAGDPVMVIQPNPASENMTVKVSCLKDDASVTITGLDGSRLYGAEIHPDGNRCASLPVDVSKFPKGIYFVKLQSAERVSIGRFVVR